MRYLSSDFLHLPFIGEGVPGQASTFLKYDHEIVIWEICREKYITSRGGVQSHKSNEAHGVLGSKTGSKIFEIK